MYACCSEAVYAVDPSTFPCAQIHARLLTTGDQQSNLSSPDDTQRNRLGRVLCTTAGIISSVAVASLW